MGVGLLMACWACGVRDDAFTGLGGAGAWPPPVIGGGSCSPANVRLCGGSQGCAPLGFEDCPGVGCTPVADRDTGESLDVGVCWPDIEQWVSSRCLACDSDEVCVRRAEDGVLYCVPVEVCEALWAQGAGNACRYADRSAYIHQPLARANGCIEPYACGGDCECDAGCAGRSPRQPFGLCRAEGVEPTTQCHPGGDTCLPGERCAVFVVPKEDRGAAEEYGICYWTDQCQMAESSGIVRCYEASGAP
ncbi:MAG: hypothetical protein U0271_39800 [Polyangiaceae bacterium]